LPEVETVVRDLRPLLLGRVVGRVAVSRRALRRPWSSAWGRLLTGQSVEEVARRGKWIVIGLLGGRALVVHLGMTGQLKVVPANAPREAHTHAVFSLDDGRAQMRYTDIRRFGSLTLFPDRAAVEHFFERSNLGPEPFALEVRRFREQLQATQRCLKAVLLDQRVVAGVGNIYADESLFEARLHPGRLGRDTSAAQARRLHAAIVTVLHRAIDRRGSSIRNYVGGSGLKGQYQEEFRVYGRTGAPCPRCRRPIERVRLAGRSTHYCPRCQRQE
jgi:formamidopyrimidine-DNA glycosylase